MKDSPDFASQMLTVERDERSVPAVTFGDNLGRMVVTQPLDPIAFKALDKALDKARQRVNLAVFERDNQIVAAAERGASLRQIADAVGLSHESVRRILVRENAR